MLKIRGSPRLYEPSTELASINMDCVRAKTRMGTATTNPAIGLCVGLFQVVVNDANGCSGSINVNIDQPTVLSLTTDTTSVTCFGLCNGEATASAIGGTGAPGVSGGRIGLTILFSS